CRPVCPATNTRLPNLVAGDRFGFGAAVPTVMISFLGMVASSMDGRERQFTSCGPGAEAPGDRVSQERRERVGFPGAAEGERRRVRGVDGSRRPDGGVVAVAEGEVGDGAFPHLTSVAERAGLAVGEERRVGPIEGADAR